MAAIHFGTDGWRAIIADDFTIENVQIIAQAVSDYIHDQEFAETGIAVSFDTRFMSSVFAEKFSEVVASNQIPVILSDRYTPTPVLSFTVKNRHLAGGIMITASHNPYYYNGIKFKGNYGGSAMSSMTLEIERHLYKNKPKSNQEKINQYLEKDDLFPDYARHIQQYIRIDTLRKFPGTLVYNPMHGTGIGYLNEFLETVCINFNVINNTVNPTFGGVLPEPIPDNLKDLRIAVLEQHALLGIATDGDADRFGILDEKGSFIELHDLMPLLYEYLRNIRKWDGDVVRTTSMADTVDKMVREYGGRVTEVPVGFKNVCERMLSEDVLIGGEESGGFGFKNHIPERDGILASLLTIEMLGYYQKPISVLVRDLRERFGPFCYSRIDKYFSPEILSRNLQLMRQSHLDRIGNFQVDHMSLVDGVKYYFTDGTWMLVRVSQTEPLGRIYVGSDTDQKVRQMLDHGIELLTKTN
ncbi:MAG: phosphoglucomutase/phosphomannomutase family protein [Candidatus Marinimicrobia bacterium]|nr:phosphoglucomutase/phosphomannomutase family protein [Candidatus Neomarinimicrobiota bacterium]